MRATMEVTPLFPTPVARVTGQLAAPLVAALVAELRQNQTEANAKNPLLSHTQVLAPQSSELYRAVQAQVAGALADFGALLFGESLHWNIKEMWMNCLQPGGQQAIHSHANSFVSGIIYLSGVHPSARTVFYRGLGGREFAFGNEGPGVRHGPFNSPKWAVSSPRPGDMVLFPSYMLHEVPSNAGPERMTLAFNAIPHRLRSWGYEVRFSHAPAQGG